MVEDATDHLLSFIKQRVPVVLTFSGVCFLLVSTCQIDDITKLNITPRSSINPFTFCLGVVLGIAGVFTYYYRDKIQVLSEINLPKIAGSYRYHVSSVDKEYFHEGECEIQQTGSTINIQGTRYNQGKKSDSGYSTSDVLVTWTTVWGSVCEDRKLRFHYYIALDKTEIVFAYCDVSLGNSKSPREFTGTYYLLPPYGDKVDNTKHGSITFVKTDTLRSSADVKLPWRGTKPAGS
jgi:hypothetical protein